MAYQDYDLVINSFSSGSSQTLSDQDKQKLEKDLNFTYIKKPVVASQFQDAETIEKEPTIQEELDEYNELSKTVAKGIDETLAEISNRAEGLTCIFDPTKEYEVSQAVLAMYDGAVGDRITWQMYLKCLEYLQEIDRLLGRQQSGQVNFA